MANSVSQEIILYTYTGSPFGGKVAFYLKLRGIIYRECPQPMTWYRPDVELLGTRYRRIPLAAIGKDIYCDSGLLLEKIEELFPCSTLGSTKSSDRAIEKLLQDWAENSVLFPGVSCFPNEMPLFEDEKFIQDRIGLWGIDFRAEARAQRRVAGLVDTRTQFKLLEAMLDDGRDWVLGTESIRLADLHAGFVFDFITSVPGSLRKEYFNSDIFPRSLAYIARYKEKVTQANQSITAEQLSGEAAVCIIEQSNFVEESKRVDKDPVELSEGQTVRVWRTDDLTSANNHFDSGRLVGLTVQEVVISVKTSKGVEVHLHYPRRNFTISIEDAAA